jgi:hypothetical protein
VKERLKMPEDKKASVVVEDEKCMDMDMPMSPYGGATSFAEIDASKAGQDYASAVDQLTYALEGIVHNITASDESTADEKAAKISAASADYRDRINALKVGQEDNKNLTLWEKFKSLFSKEQLALLDSQVDQVKEEVVGLKDRGFKVYEDTSGQKRWLALSSNSFEDLDKELFTTKALEEAIEYADKTGERGPLLVFHVPGSDIGQCDYQAMAGRFLVESGTFADTPLGRKAVEYFTNTDEEHQVSIGYQYIKGDELDGQYDWMRFRERSALPVGTAANPWTDFTVIGDNPMEEIKAQTLRKIFGDELANGVIANAETKTKELEEQGVRFKNKTAAPIYDEKELGPITDVETVEEKKEEEIPVLAHVHGNVKHTHRVIPESEHAHTGLEAFKAAKKMPMEDDGGDADPKENADKKPPFAKKEGELDENQTTQLATLLAGLVEDVGAVRDTVAALQDDVKALKRADEEKQADLMTPRGFPSFPGGIRPSESNSNIVKDEKAIENLDKEEDDLPVNPAFAYVQDLLQPGARLTSN